MPYTQSYTYTVYFIYFLQKNTAYTLTYMVLAYLHTTAQGRFVSCRTTAPPL